MSDLEQELVDELGEDTELEPDEETVVDDGEDGEEVVEEEEDGESTEPDSLSLLVARDKAWDRVRKYLARNLGEIEGDDATLYHECFVCNSFGSPGFIRTEPLSPEVIATLHSWLGMRDPTELRPDQHSQECPECAGEGLVAMPSKVAGQTELPCTKCGALGWLGTDPQRGGYSSPLGNGSQPVVGSGLPMDMPVLEPDAPEPPEVAVLRGQGFMVTKIPVFTA
jgi:hypothetical protein